MPKPNPVAYSGLQKALHWLIAGMVAIMLPVCFYMVNRGAATNFDALTNQLYTAHKTFGFVLLWLVAWRIVVKFRRGVPAPVSTLSSFQVFVSDAVHKSLSARQPACCSDCRCRRSFLPISGWPNAYSTSTASLPWQWPRLSPCMSARPSCIGSSRKTV